jgi:hypothetical protein
MSRKPLLIGLLGLLVAVTAYLYRSDDFAAGVRNGYDAAREGTPAIAEVAPGSGAASAAEAGSGSDAASAAAQPAPGGPLAWDDADWDVFSRTAHWALDHGVDALALGDAVVAIGRTFVGTPYVPRTLEAEGPERLIIDFRRLDCVTFVETALTTARFVRDPEAAALLRERARAEDRYEALLRRLRYRGGELAGYPSRLHYFTDWIVDGEGKGLLRDVTRDLGGVRDTERVDFMSMHVEAYRQLEEDPGALAAIRRAEERLSAAGRWYVPEDRIAAVAGHIRDGDVIAATSTVPGLDVAHTGLALHVDGELRLMHAPLVGDSVQISEETLAARILRITGQDGIVVARPREGGDG